jgi:hypothetical protein
VVYGVFDITTCRVIGPDLNPDTDDTSKLAPAPAHPGELVALGRQIDIVEIDAASNRGIDNARRNQLEGDLIANLVYDKTRRFNFVVAGDFDLDFDGKIDDPAGQKVIKLIEKWGGQIRPTVDTSIDFVILGSPPMTPEKPADTADDAAKQRAAEQNEAYKAFQAIKEEAKALSIPILTRTQFLRFMGTTVPSKAIEDQPAL